MASRVALASIPALTFYSDKLTQSRRTPPIQQLTCVGKPCNIFQPDVVRCVNTGGHGTDVDWKCEADLPESLRFGRVEVSCEGWSGPGDPMVLKGSCGLEYRLVRIPSGLQNDDPYMQGSWWSAFNADNILKTIFMTIWTLVLLFILYSFLKSCFTRAHNHTPARPPTRPSGGGWFPGHRPDDTNDPPPYSRYGKPPQGGSAWSPGFWTGLGLGAVSATLWGRQRDPGYVPPQRSAWDWERQSRWWGGTPRQTAPPATASDGFRRTEGARRARVDDDRGEGPSNLGSMRRSTGWGGSSVR